ncbi:Ubiquitin carboxyl-terminal hydrolase 34 [Hypsibius exemplaris]|uniref:Ubiquitin carboxyl-terminal hydrolase 34 n=1 Tax=Hypsibius exemplaris TaxID=2072580 RepID=A0A1W0WAH4_HYPEX|nr:Ubiquitin carboxyl-terminal hydrolase 34 [Hypsibius exemplaris]
MPPGKDVCLGCEEIRPLLHRFRAWKEDPDTKYDQGEVVTDVRPLTHEEAGILLRFLKHWPNNQHVAHNHITFLFKSAEDIEAFRGVTLSFITLGVRLVASWSAIQDKRASDVESQRQQASSSRLSDPLSGLGTDTPRSENPTPVSEPDSVVAISPTADISLSPTPDSRTSASKAEPDVIDICDSPVMGPALPPPTILSEQQKDAMDTTQSSGSDAGPAGERLSESRSSDSASTVSSTWHSKDYDDFGHSFHRVFLSQSYPLYLAARVFSLREDRNRSEPLHQQYLRENFFYWITHQGLSLVTDFFAKANVENTDLSQAYILVTMAYHARHFVYFENFTNAIATFRINVINYLLSLPMEEFRKPYCRTIADLMWQMRRDPTWPHSTFDLEGLNLAHKFFTCSSHLTLRLVGIDEMNQCIHLFHNMLTQLDQRLAAQLGSHMANWILEKRIVEEVFGQNAHVEIIGRSVKVIDFLSTHQCLSVAQLDCIWNAAQMNYISRQVFEMLPSVTRLMEPPLLMHLYEKLREIEPACHTELTINVVSAVIKAIWTSSAASQKPVLGMLPKRSSVSYGAGDKSLSYTSAGGRSSSEGSGSSGSASGSEEDSNSEYDSDEPVGNVSSKIPAISTLCHRTPSSQLLNAAYLKKNLKLQLPEVVGKTASGAKIVAVVEEESSEEGSSESGDDGEDEGDDDDEDEDMLDVSLTSDSDARRSVRHPARAGVASIAPSRAPATSPIDDFPYAGPWKSEAERRAVTKGSDITEKILNVPTTSSEPRPRLPPGLSLDSESLFNQFIRGDLITTSTTNMASTSGGNVLPAADCSFSSSNLPEDEDMGQDSDCADNEVNSSTSDMSQKEQDLDMDLSETVAEGNLADLEEDDGMDVVMMKSASSPRHSFLGSTSEESLKIKSLHILSQKCRQNYHDTWKAKEINYKLDDAAKPGMTLLWDLIQQHTSATVSLPALVTAERELISLIMSMNNARLAARFAEACHENVRQHRAVSVSLRILPRLMQSYNCSQSMDFIALAAADFFADLVVFADTVPESEGQKATEIRVRLQFLQFIYSNQLTDKKFRLTKAQLDVMWMSFVHKLRALDELCQWFIVQLNTADYHALNAAVAYHLFYAYLGRIEAAAMTLTAFKLYQQCLNYLLIMAPVDATTPKTPGTAPSTCVKSECADRVWIYAMFGEAEVSEIAIRHLNNFYISTVKTCKDGVMNYKEQELYQRSMGYMVEAMQTLDVHLSSFTTIIRGFTLMRKQIETFRQRYGFHLRLWHLAGCGILSHNFHFGVSNNMRNYCFFHVSFPIEDSSNRMHEVTVTLAPGQYLGELKAEIAFAIWKLTEKHPGEPRDARPCINELYQFVENRGAMFVAHHQREYGPDQDEVQLHELGFRQENNVFINFGARIKSATVGKPKESKPGVSMPPPPLREVVPMIIAASPQNFETFFELQRRLDLLAPNCTPAETSRMQLAELEGEILRKQLSRHLWDFLMLLPTSEAVLAQLRLQAPRDRPTVDDWKTVLPGDNPHQLLYALQALENLIREPNAHGAGVYSHEVTHVWADHFIEKGGFHRLYELLMSPPLQEGGATSDGVDHQRDCLSSLIRVVYLFCMEPQKVKADEDSEVSDEESSDDEVVLGSDVAAAVAAAVLIGPAVQPKKRKGLEKAAERATSKRARQEMLLREGPRFRNSILQILDTGDVLTAILRIQFNGVLSASGPDTQKPNRSARLSRQSLVRLGFDFLYGWATCNHAVFSALSQHPFLTEWLRRLILESLDSAITGETCAFIEKMCRHEPQYELGGALLTPLVGMMSVAEGVKCLRNAGREDKSPLRPSPRFFYDSISKLLEIMPGKFVVEKVDLDSLCEQLANSLETRPIHEPRHGNLEDDGLIGLLKVASQVLAHNPAFKFKPAGMKMLLTVYSCLFDLPCPKNRDLPKCKSAASRFQGYICLIEMCRCSPENFVTLGRLLLKEELSRNCLHWDYWPRDDTRADCGYVGIMNLGATCYMATTMQHLYMIPEARRAVFEAVPPTDCGKQDWAPTALHELQRMFAFLMESERKAYSPDGFCRVYEMNSQVLNPSEQKDMMEFFSDLVSKMEEMSPSSRHVFKRLFTGTNCNTVVSLDCGHVSQTTEDFTTVRCQVNNMRTLYESLDDVCVKDVLEGNNMYKCGQCDREVRAEKQACFRSLPEVLVLNTMRYSFNMVSMQREKVNTHFSFPLLLDMSKYMEENQNLLQPRKSAESPAPGAACGSSEKYMYELIGVTVHTGTADGGHYYSFIRDLEHGEEDRWYLFNDAEVRVFDPEQLADECFGGDQPKQFDHPGERYLDFGLEKTNSAYMLFYMRSEKVREQVATSSPARPTQSQCVPKDLQKWVFDDTVSFVRDTIVFDRHYFDFIWRLCGVTPGSIMNKEHQDSVIMAGQLGIAFVWETLIHSRDRILLNSFFDMTSKWGPLHPVIAEWFVRQMVDDHRWLFSILVMCPLATVRYTFQRYIISLIVKLRQPVSFLSLYVHETAGYSLHFLLGKCCLQCISILNDAEVRIQWRHLSDLMHVLLEFAKIGSVESFFLLSSCQVFVYALHFYNYVRRLKESRSSLIGPLFPLSTNFLEMAMLGTVDDRDSSDRFSPDLDKDKPNALSLMVMLLRTCVENFQENVFTCKQMHAKNPSTSCGCAPLPTHSNIEEYLGGLTDQEQLDFICNLFRDGVEPQQAPRLAAMLYFGKPEKGSCAVRHIVQKIVDLSTGQSEGIGLSKKERDRESQIKAYLNALSEMTKAGMSITCRLMGENLFEGGEEAKDELEKLGVPNYLDYLVGRLDSLVAMAPLQTFPWLADCGRSPDALREWTLRHFDLVMDLHGVAIGKPPSALRDEIQLEVARLMVSLPGEPRMKDVFCSNQNSMLSIAVKERQANAATALDKIDLHLTAEQSQTVETLIDAVLGYLGERLPQKHPLILEPTLSNESYQWILFAVQFLLVDEDKQLIVHRNFVGGGLRALLMAHLVPTPAGTFSKQSGNRQALLQVLAVAALHCPAMTTALIEDAQLIDILLTDVEVRPTDDAMTLEREGRYTGAALLLLNALCLTDGEFACRMAEDPRLLAKLKKAMHLKFYDMCRRPLLAIIGTLVGDAPYPPERSRSGDAFRRAMYNLIAAIRAQWPTITLVASHIVRKIIEGSDDDFQTYGILNKLMEMLTEYYRTCYSAVNKTLSYLYEESNWSMMTLRKLHAFACQAGDANPPIREALQAWQVYAKQVSREVNLDIVAQVEGTGPVEIGPRLGNAVTPRRGR